jgi:protein-tyrosine phosphatase
MFNFFKKQRKPLFEGLCDFHNHLLPGIDDGSKDVEMSLKMLALYKELGFKSIITSPHVYQELYPNTPVTIKAAFDLLSKNISDSDGPDLRSYAAEYMVDEVFTDKLEQEVPALTFNGDHVLLEINFFSNTELLKKACFDLSQRNISPILAHPERYHLLEDVAAYEQLKNQGFYFQLNALALLGQYGPDVKEKAFKLLHAGLYDFVGTDAHTPRHLESLQSLTLSKKETLRWDSIREFQLNCFSS